MLTLKNCKDIVEACFDAASVKIALIKAIRDAQRDAYEVGFKAGRADAIAQIRVELDIMEDLDNV